jgi:hypothetical protein
MQFTFFIRLNLRGYIHFIFLLTHEWAQEATAFVTGKPFRPFVMQHSNLLVPFLSDEAK